MQHRWKLAISALVFSAPVLSQATRPNLLDAARNMAGLLQLSPAGTEFWARQSLKRATGDDYDGITRVEVEIGREVARPSPDRRRLQALVEQYADRSAALARRTKTEELDDMFQLSATDRQKVGQFIQRNAQEGLRKKSPVLEVLP